MALLKVKAGHTPKLRAPKATSAPAPQRLSTAIANHPAVANEDRAWKVWAARNGHLERTLEVALNKARKAALKNETDA